MPGHSVAPFEFPRASLEHGSLVATAPPVPFNGSAHFEAEDEVEEELGLGKFEFVVKLVELSGR